MGFAASRGRGIGWQVWQSLKNILQNALLLLRLRFGALADVTQPATESTADSPRPDGEEPVTALPPFDGAMILYAYASGRLVGVESSKRTVLLKQQLPAEIFLHCSLTEIPCLKCNAGLESFVALFKANHLLTFQPAGSVGIY
ncbi:FBP [Symbiodinium sp. CCMP2456]|nr:FBP [Symbiodinium sp. CCMP2456]